jgi:hypothetical protein
LDGIHSDIREVLNPKQQSKWDEMFYDFVDNWFPPSPGAKAKSE